MDGVKRRVNHSLQRQLSIWLSFLLVAAALIAGGFSFYATFDEAHEFQDDQLMQVTALVVSHAPADWTLPAENAAKFADPESRIVIQWFDARGLPLFRGPGLWTSIPVGLAEGVQSLTVNQASWRIFVRTMPGGMRLVVGQLTEGRDEIALDSGRRALMPLLVLIPVMLMLVRWVVRRKLHPVLRLSKELDRRDENDLRPLDDQRIPDEIQPVTASINRLLLRVGQSFDMQRRFVADAAHELRSPLTALSLQVEGLQGVRLSSDARQRLATLSQGVQRARSLLEQLLSLARSQGIVPAAAQRVSVRAVFRHVVEDLIVLAERKKIDLGVLGDEDVVLNVIPVDLETLLRNLVDNAIRYTPAGGRVDLDVHTSGGLAIMDVIDTGPGIAVSERERVFDPFYRVLGSDEQGSGLGLSIVRTLVGRLGGEIHLDDAEPGARPPGLRVRVACPLP
jgi:two-component system OmpR family sensor kinase